MQGFTVFVVLVCKKKTVKRVVRRISHGTKTDHTESVTSRLYRSSTYVTRLAFINKHYIVYSLFPVSYTHLTLPTTPYV